MIKILFKNNIIKYYLKIIKILLEMDMVMQ